MLSRTGSTVFTNGPSAVDTRSKHYTIKTVESVTLEQFSGLTPDFKDWYDSVANAYDICGY